MKVVEFFFTYCGLPFCRFLRDIQETCYHDLCQTLNFDGFSYVKGMSETKTREWETYIILKPWPEEVF
jgi:hypothetical protein